MAISRTFAGGAGGIGAAPRPTDAVHRRVLSELYQFTDWCSAFGVRGFIGEFGVPASGADVGRWNAVLETYYRGLDEAGVWATQWASGGGWGTGYELSVYVNGVPDGNVDTAMPAATVLERHPGVGGVRRGTALAGWDFPVNGGGGSGIRNPGAYYTVHTNADFAYLASRGVRTVRLSMAWERLQPTLGAALDSTFLTQLGGFLGYAAANRVGVILDLHNYARYTDAGDAVLVLAEAGGDLTTAELSDFWTRLSAWVRADEVRNRTVVAYGLMNEPHDLAAGDFVVGSTLYDFAAGVGSWTGTPTRTTTIFGDGAATWSVPADGAQYDDAGDWGDLGQFGNTLRMVFRAPAAMAGTFSVDLKAQRGAGNVTGNDYSTASAGLNSSISTSTPTVMDWVASDGTFDSVRWVGFYAGGNGRSGAQNLYLDRVQMGTLKTPIKVWESISADVVEALRTAGDSRTVCVGGYAYSQLATWSEMHLQPWVDDPNVVYEAHHYWDNNRTGTYTESYADVVTDAEGEGF